MEQEAFRARIVSAVEGYGEARLQQAEFIAGRYMDEGRTDESDLQEALERLRLPPVPPYHEIVEATTRAEASLPPDRATESILVEKLRPWVEGVREQVFDTREAPFRSVEDARPWLAVAWKHRRRPISKMSDEQTQRFLDLRDQIDAVREELEQLQDAQLVIQYRTEETPCWLPENERKRRKPTGIKLEDIDEAYRASLGARVFTGEVWEEPIGIRAGPYRVFGAELRRLSQATGFHRIDLADLVLTGRRPRLPSATIGIHGPPLGPEREDGSHNHSYLTIRLNSPLNYKDLRKLHAELRDLWREAYDPPPDVRLLFLVTRMVLGEDVAGFSKKGWEKVGAELKKLGYKGRTDPRTLATRYWRWMEQIDY